MLGNEINLSYLPFESKTFHKRFERQVKTLQSAMRVHYKQLHLVMKVEAFLLLYWLKLKRQNVALFLPFYKCKKICKRGGKFGPLIGKISKPRCLSYLMFMVSHPFDFSSAHLAFTLTCWMIDIFLSFQLQETII